ncbi:GNAT family N-acetyltransferase [Sporobolomyces salmoneus]|uniref:GNAT family N-acetyltransferase n=1 Tax=Sporobolomyces salmoneus TaxID=183962 RepID=UPI0031720493
MSSILSALPELPPLIPAGTKINGKPIRIPPRVNLGSLTVNNLGTVKKLHNCLFPVSYSDRFYDDSLNLDLAPEEFNKLVFYQDLPVGVLVSRIEPLSNEAPKDLDQAVSNPSTEQNDDNKNGYKLYIMTLGVLAPYRNQGLASKLIHHLLSSASQTLLQPATTETPAPSSTSVESTPTAATPAPPLSKKALKKAAQKGKAPPPPPPAAAKAEESTADPAEEEKERKKKERAEQEAKRSKRRIEKITLHVQVGNEEGKKFWEKFGFKVVDTVPNYYRKIEPRDAWLMERPVLPPSSSTSS